MAYMILKVCLMNSGVKEITRNWLPMGQDASLIGQIFSQRLLFGDGGAEAVFENPGGRANYRGNSQ